MSEETYFGKLPMEEYQRLLDCEAALRALVERMETRLSHNTNGMYQHCPLCNAIFADTSYWAGDVNNHRSDCPIEAGRKALEASA